MIHKLLDKNAD